jgi:hypothetical protein
LSNSIKSSSSPHFEEKLPPEGQAGKARTAAGLSFYNGGKREKRRHSAACAAGIWERNAAAAKGEFSAGAGEGGAAKRQSGFRCKACNKVTRYELPERWKTKELNHRDTALKEASRRSQRKDKESVSRVRGENRNICAHICVDFGKLFAKCSCRNLKNEMFSGLHLSNFRTHSAVFRIKRLPSQVSHTSSTTLLMLV